MSTVERNLRQRTTEPFIQGTGGDDGPDPLAEQAQGLLRAGQGAVDKALSGDSTKFLSATRQSNGGE